MITVFVYARLWRRAGVMTDVELVEMRYAGKPAAALRGMRALYIALLVNPIIIGWVTGAMVTLLDETVMYGAAPWGWETQLFGDSALTMRTWLVLGGSLAFIGLYCTLSGMWGVAVTDAVQFCLAMLGCLLLAIVAVRHVGGVDALQTRVMDSFGDGGQAFRFIPEFSADNAWLPLHVFLIMLLVQWWATWYPGAEPGGGGYVVQRMASCKDERNSIFATLWYQLAHYCIRPWPWLIVAFAALVMYPDLRASELQNADFDSGVGFPRVIRDLSPPGLRGLLMVTFFAAFMSTISTQMNWGASYLVRDFYQRFLAPNASEAQLTRASRFASVIVLSAGAIAAVLMQDMSVDGAWKMLAALGAGTGAVFMLRWFWWRINAWSEITSMAGSLVFFLSVDPVCEALGRDAPRAEVKMLIVALLTICTWVLVTLLTPPERPEILDSFFQLVRPGGAGWRPVAARNTDVRVDEDLLISIVAALFATGIVYFTLPCIGNVIFGHHRVALLCGVAAAACMLVVAVLVRRLVRSDNLAKLRDA